MVMNLTNNNLYYLNNEPIVHKSNKMIKKIKKIEFLNIHNFFY